MSEPVHPVVCDFRDGGDLVAFQARIAAIHERSGSARVDDFDTKTKQVKREGRVCDLIRTRFTLRGMEGNADMVVEVTRPKSRGDLTTVEVTMKADGFDRIRIVEPALKDWSNVITSETSSDAVSDWITSMFVGAYADQTACKAATSHSGLQRISPVVALHESLTAMLPGIDPEVMATRLRLTGPYAMPASMSLVVAGGEAQEILSVGGSLDWTARLPGIRVLRPISNKTSGAHCNSYEIGPVTAIAEPGSTLDDVLETMRQSSPYLEKEGWADARVMERLGKLRIGVREYRT